MTEDFTYNTPYTKFADAFAEDEVLDIDGDPKEVKHYVLDTCVLLHDPTSITSFQENNVYLPLVVIEELDKFKKEENENGRNARTVTRLIDELRGQGSLTKGVKLPNGGTLKVLTKYNATFEVKINDDKILASAESLANFHSGAGAKPGFKPLKVVLVTNDINMRVRANIYGIEVEPFGKKMKKEELHTGVRELIVEQPEYAYFKQYGHLKLPLKNVEFSNPLANEYLVLINASDEKKAAMGRYDLLSNSIQRIKPINEKVYGITPKNEEQACALDALMNPDVALVTLIGKAGSGKTLIAIASALELTIEQKLYDKILIARPVQPMGKDIGYLPGTLEEKLSPWMQPIFDNLEFLFNNKKRHGGDSKDYIAPKKTKKSQRPPEPKAGKGPGSITPDSPKKGKDYDYLLESGVIQVEALTYIRGRSIPKQLIIIDEAQNLSPHEIKTIITRAGEGTKIILTGDTQQIDSPYLDELSNGLTYAVERLKELDITSHVTLFECERSPLAEAGTKYL